MTAPTSGLDEPRSGLPPESGPVVRFDPSAELRGLFSVLAALRPATRAEAKEALGRRLAETIGRERGAFTTSYLENVVAGRQEAGAPLVRALRALWIARNGGSPIAGAFEPIEVRSRGDVEPGSLILGGSTRCENCGVPFVGRENQRTCSKVCKAALDAKRHKEKRRKR